MTKEIKRGSMFNATEIFLVENGHNNRWGREEGKGFTFPEKPHEKVINGGNLISKENRRAAMKAAR